MLDHALAWAARGFPVFPLRVGGKSPAIKRWQDMATTDPERITKMWNREYNVGVLTLGLIVVDIDDKDGKTGSLDWELTGLPSNTLTVGTPSGGRHLYFKTTENVGNSPLTDSIDIRACGEGLVVAPGSVFEGKTYTLLLDVPVLDAPEGLLRRLKTVKKADIKAIGELDTDEAIQRATSWLEQRRGAVEGEHGDIFTVTTANHVMDMGLSPEMTFDLMEEHWNDKCSPPWELEGEDSLRAKVESAAKSRNKPLGATSPEAEFGGVQVEAPPPVVKAPKAKPRYLWAGDKSLDLSQQWLMYNRLPRIGTAMMVGPSNSGKTFLSLDLAVKLANGEPWLGKETDERVGTVILSSEGIGGLPTRIKHLPEVPVVATTVGVLGEDKVIIETIEVLKDLRAELKTRFDARLGLIILDTLTSSNLLENENDNGEVGRAVKKLEAFAHAFECLVLVTHHPPKTGTGARGGGAIHAGFDVMIEIFQEQHRSERFVECTKGRDARVEPWGAFKLSPVIVEHDLTGRGRDSTTMEVVYGDWKRSKIDKKPPPKEHVDLFIGAIDWVRTDSRLPKGSPVKLDLLRLRYKEIMSTRRGSFDERWLDMVKFTKDSSLVTVFADRDDSSVLFIVEGQSTAETGVGNV